MICGTGCWASAAMYLYSMQAADAISSAHIWVELRGSVQACVCSSIRAQNNLQRGPRDSRLGYFLSSSTRYCGDSSSFPALQSQKHGVSGCNIETGGEVPLRWLPRPGREQQCGSSARKSIAAHTPCACQCRWDWSCPRHWRPGGHRPSCPGRTPAVDDCRGQRPRLRQHSFIACLLQDVDAMRCPGEQLACHFPMS